MLYYKGHPGTMQSMAYKFGDYIYGNEYKKYIPEESHCTVLMFKCFIA